MTNPLNDFLEEFGQTKQAGPIRDVVRNVGDSFGKALMVGAGTALAATAVGGAALGASAIHRAATKSRDFRNMMELNPDLRTFHEQDPKMFNQLYTSLHRANHAYASDPIIAGTYMRKMMDNPMTAGGILTDAMSGAPSGGLMSDVGRAGRDAATSQFRDSISGSFGRREPSAEDQVKDIRNQRMLEYLRAHNDPNSPGYFGPGGGGKKQSL